MKDIFKKFISGFFIGLGILSSTIFADVITLQFKTFTTGGTLTANDMNTFLTQIKDAVVTITTRQDVDGTTLSQAVSSISTLQSNVTSHSASITNLDSKVDQTAKELFGYSDSIIFLGVQPTQSSLKSLGVRVGTLETELSSLKNRTSTLESKASALEAAVSSLGSRLSVVESSLGTGSVDQRIQNAINSYNSSTVSPGFSSANSSIGSLGTRLNTLEGGTNNLSIDQRVQSALSTYDSNTVVPLSTSVSSMNTKLSFGSNKAIVSNVLDQLTSDTTYMEKVTANLLYTSNFSTLRTQTISTAISSGSTSVVNKIDSGGSSLIPVGTIIAWDKVDRDKENNLISLPDGWVECNGQTITLTKYLSSQYYGTKVPNLNGKTANGAGRFLRGKGFDVVGEEAVSSFLRISYGSAFEYEEDMSQGHKHVDTGHNHSLASSYGYATDGGGIKLVCCGAGSATGVMINGSLSDTNYRIYNLSSNANITLPMSDGTNGDPRTGKETRPVSMKVVWIIKIL